MRRIIGVAIFTVLVLASVAGPATADGDGIAFDLRIEGCLEADSTDPATISLAMANLGSEPLEMTVMFQNRSNPQTSAPWYSLQQFTIGMGASATASFDILPVTLGPAPDPVDQYRNWVVKAWDDTPFVNTPEFQEGYAFIPTCPDEPESKADCKSGGWETFGFRNQGQCVRFIETGKDSR